eukprot:TRINITY_DN59211_c0_g1_i1.p2 TRINITY_DN59211_c0_g1~~TRINITY_DN59211_c0_g1_i1.p2  ORF type:complete len:110 (+),score=2.59 TRINITY_DN59211_c0_g1_i1:528-857(+)
MIRTAVSAGEAVTTSRPDMLRTPLPSIPGEPPQDRLRCGACQCIPNTTHHQKYDVSCQRGGGGGGSGGGGLGSETFSLPRSYFSPTPTPRPGLGQDPSEEAPLLLLSAC